MTGGETPLNSGAWLLDRLIAEAPEFVKELQEKVASFVFVGECSTQKMIIRIQGVTYTIYHPPLAISGDVGGNGVRNAWGSQIQPDDDEATIKAKIEAQVKRISPETTWEWQSDGGLFTMQRVPGDLVRISPSRVAVDMHANSL